MMELNEQWTSEVPVASSLSPWCPAPSVTSPNPLPGLTMSQPGHTAPLWTSSQAVSATVPSPQSFVQLCHVCSAPWSTQLCITPQLASLSHSFATRVPQLWRFILLPLLNPSSSPSCPNCLSALASRGHVVTVLLSQAPYLDILSVFTSLDLRVLPSSHVWMYT